MVNVHNEAKYAIATSDYRCLACEHEVACEALYYSAVMFGDGAFQRRNYCVGCWKRDSAPESGDTETRNGIDAFASWRSRRPVAPSESPRKIRFDPQLAMEFFLRLGEEPSQPPDLDDEDELDSVALQADEDHTGDDRAEHAESAGAELAEPEVAEPIPAGPEVAGDAVEDDAATVEAKDTSAADESSARAGPGTESERDQLRFFIALLLVRKKALKFKSSIDRGGREYLLLVDRETPPRVHEVLNPGLSEGQLERLKERLGELLQMRI